MDQAQSEVISRDRQLDHPRLSPPTPLAPLEFLQNQRRGSITDPFLHAGPVLPPLSAAISPRSSQSNLRQYPSPQDTLSKNTVHQNTPGSPYNSLGDASVHPSKPLARSQNSPGGRGKGNFMSSFPYADRRGDDNDMDTDNIADPHILSGLAPDDPRYPYKFDYNKRRHSLPTGAQIGIGHPARGGPLSPSQVGAKRKMSSDRVQLPAVGEEFNPKLTGPGVHNVRGHDGLSASGAGEPATKRRNSAFDTQRIAQLSLNDRRDSLDSRMSSATPSSTWWQGDRRDSNSSMFSGTSLGSSPGFNSPGFSGEMHVGRQPNSMSAFTWPPNAGPSDTSIPIGVQSTPVDPVLRQFEPPIPPHSTVSSNSMPVDRRMSAPDAMSSSAGARADRSLRSRSRPPSRSAIIGSRASAAPPSPVISPNGAKVEDSPTSSVSPSTTHSAMREREPGSQPYSRSPELRVSHKLAERKRRKEMRDLFDELRDQLPADRGMKASKWEILSKAIDYIQQLKQSSQDMSREIEMLRHEMEVRHGVPSVPYGPPHPVLYPPPSAPHYVPSSGQPPHATHLPPPQPQNQGLSRPSSSHNAFASVNGPSLNVPNGKAQSQSTAIA